MNISNEIQLSIDNFKSSKRNYQKSIPNSSVLIDLEENVSVLNIDLKIQYDVDAIIGIIKKDIMQKVFISPIEISYNKTKIKVKEFFVKENENNFNIKNLNSLHFSTMKFSDNIRLEIYFITKKIKFNKNLINDIYRRYYLIIKNTSNLNIHFDSIKNEYKGRIPNSCLSILSFVISQVVPDEEVYIYFECFGTKKIFCSNMKNYVFLELEKYINVKHNTILIDFCMSYFDLSGNVIYPKTSVLLQMGERPNYFQFFSFKNPCVSRFRSKYVSCSKFFSENKINKLNFYSSTQDYFDELCVFGYYPILSKNLMNDILTKNNFEQYHKYSKELNKIKNKIKTSLTTVHTLPSYRFEFRIPYEEVNKINFKLLNLLKVESFFYFNRSEFLDVIFKNTNTMLKIFNKIKKGLVNIGKFVILETILISSFLRGDIFKMPFSTPMLRGTVRSMWLNNFRVIEEEFFLRIVESDEHYEVLENFIKTVDFLDDIMREEILYLLQFKTIFFNKELLRSEINALIYCDQNFKDKEERIYSINPIDFFINEYYYHMNPIDPLRQMIDVYTQNYDFKIYNEIFKAKNKFYYDFTKEIITFNDKIVFETVRKEKETKLKAFISKIPKTNILWNKNELEEISFMKYIYLSNKSQINLIELYDNFVFSFHLRRSFLSFKNQFYKTLPESEFIFLNFKKRFEYIETVSDSKVSCLFRKEYMFLVYQDLLRLKLIQ